MAGGRQVDWQRRSGNGFPGSTGRYRRPAGAMPRRRRISDASRAAHALV